MSRIKILIHFNHFYILQIYVHRQLNSKLEKIKFLFYMKFIIATTCFKLNITGSYIITFYLDFEANTKFLIWFRNFHLFLTYLYIYIYIELNL